MLKTSKALLMVAGLLTLGVAMPSEVEATPISGEVHFAGSADWIGGNYTNATGLDFTGPVGIFEDVSTGAYSGLLAGTQATFTDIPSGIGPGVTGPLNVPSFWSFTDAGTGWTYSF